MFEISSGSVIGNYHTRIGLNNQDFFGYNLYDDCLFAVVCDGCGSGLHSEVGAKIGVNLLLKDLVHLKSYINNSEGSLEQKLECLKISTMNSISCISYMIGDELVNIIKNYFLFTTLIVGIGKEKSFIASIGDGFYVLNNNCYEIGPYENNAPPYLSYALIPDLITFDNLKNIEFNIHQDLNTNEVSNILIATDGLLDLINQNGKFFPEDDKEINPINDFWENDLYFKNKFAMSRRLNKFSKSYTKLKDNMLIKHSGFLNDDTTIISIRRMEEK